MGRRGKGGGRWGIEGAGAGVVVGMRGRGGWVGGAGVVVGRRAGRVGR